MRIKKRKIVLYVLSMLTFIAPIVTLSLYFSNLSENTLPKQVEFKIDNPKMQAKISLQVQPIIKKALKEHTKRSQLLTDISEVLATYDIIDTYNIRLGFDGRLVIYANVQKPVMAVHVKNGDVFIIGSAMKIIEKNPNALVLNSVPNIYFPEIQIKDKKDKSIDYAWFLNQINLINDNFQWYDNKVQKIVWTNSIGFTVKLQNSENTSDLFVYLGRNEIDTKVEKLKTIASVLKQKNLKPSEIDLDLLDRAFIK